MVRLQATLFCKSGKYRPVSTLIDVPSIAYYNEHKEEIKKRAITNICAKRCWTAQDLKAYNYTLYKIRVYDKDKILREKQERYEQIKKERGWK